MKTTIRILASATFAFLVANHSLHAQLVADGTTASINAVTTNITGNLTIGTNGSFTTLVITNAGAVTNSGNGVIGQNSSARTNQVIVTGANSRWGVGGNLNFGVLGSFSRLIVTNGGRVENNFGNMAFNGGVSNAAVVTGAGSVWTNRGSVNIGNSGSFNQVLVTNNGRLGAGGGVNVGNGGSSNQLLITSGGVVTSSSGALTGNTGSRGNVAVVRDVNSLWTMSSGLTVGANGDFNRLLVTNGAKIFSSGAYVGANSIQSGIGHSNLALLAGAGSTLTNTLTSAVGNFGSFNQLIVSNGAVMRNSSASDHTIGFQTGSSNNTMLVSGTNSLFANRGAFAQLYVGLNGSFNRMSVRDGGRVEADTTTLGVSVTSTNNVAVVADPGSTLLCSRDMNVGSSGSFNQLIVTNAGTVLATGMTLGAASTSANNRSVIEGGSLIVTNAAGNAVFDVRRGTNELKAGFIEVDRLRVTNTLGEFELTDGTLLTRSTTNDNGRVFGVGVNNGSAPAVFQLAGNGIHFFGNGLSIANSGYLTGNGTIIGDVTVQTLGTLSPGASVGKLVLSNSPALQGKTVMEISKNGSALTNDQVQVAGPLTYGGSLVVSNLGPTALAVGDRFQLFIASSYGGAFAPVTLPALGEGFAWTNKLLVDGSIEVVANVTRPFGVDVSHFQNESGIPQASWDQMYAEGKRFAFIKATEGLTGPHDATMAVNVQRAAAAGLLVGVYHYAHPENRPTTNGAILEASNMVVYAGSAIGVGRLRPVLDLEGSAANLSTTALTDWVIAFCNEIIARRGPAAAPIIYVTQTFANNELDSRLANYDLWLRTVGSGANPAVDDPPGQGFADATGVFNDWSFWQYSATGSSGGISPLDLDVCHEEFKPLASYVITNVVQSPVQLSGMTVGPNGGFQFSFSNAPGALFTVLATTNVALSLSNWEVVGGVTEISPGLFQFTDPQATNHAQRFYRVRWP